MSKIKVRLKKNGVVNVKLKPANGVKVKTDTTYLYDPDLLAGWVDLAQDWAVKTDGMVEEEGVGIDYSSKAYAIGGTGTETNNAKYYAEQASNSETSASNSANTASIQAGIATTQAGIATTKAGQASTSEANALSYSQSAASSANDASHSAADAYASEQIATQKASDASDSASAAHTSELNVYGYEERSRVWAEGNDEEVEDLGGTHSSLVSAGLAYAYANASEDVPVEEFAANHNVIVHGEKGDKGDKGDTGSAATIAVGTVTTGAAGSSASVTNGGTSYAAVFNFVIPKGDKGDTGEPGPAGTYTAGTGIDITSGTISVDFNEVAKVTTFYWGE